MKVSSVSVTMLHDWIYAYDGNGKVLWKKISGMGNIGFVFLFFLFHWINIVTVILVSYVHRHRLPGGRNPLWFLPEWRPPYVQVKRFEWINIYFVFSWPVNERIMIIITIDVDTNYRKTKKPTNFIGMAFFITLRRN